MKEAGEKRKVVSVEDVSKVFDVIDDKLGDCYEISKTWAGITNLLIYCLNKAWEETDGLCGYIEDFKIKHLGLLVNEYDDKIKDAVKSTYDAMSELRKAEFYVSDPPSTGIPTGKKETRKNPDASPMN